MPRSHPAHRRRFRPASLLAPVLLALTFAAGSARAQEPDTWKSVARVVAVGDVHGDLAQLMTVLRDAAVIDENGHWIGAGTHLVQTGDRIDRWADSRKVMDLVMALEKEAKKAGGAVHALVGNHEAMNILGDLRYVTPEEFNAYRTPDSERLRDALFARTFEGRRGPAPTPAERSKWENEHPVGFVEQRLAFLPTGKYGAWIGRQNTVLQVGDTLFLHGGISPKYADFSLHDANERVRHELHDADPVQALVANDPEGPLWYRGLAQGDASLAGHVETVLRHHGCRRIVIGHTPTEGLVMPRYAGRVLVIDVGLSRFFGGPPAALILEEGQAFALYRGHKLALPEADGEPVLRYVREVVALEPDPARYKALVDRLEAEVSAARAPAPR